MGCGQSSLPADTSSNPTSPVSAAGGAHHQDGVGNHQIPPLADPTLAAPVANDTTVFASADGGVAQQQQHSQPAHDPQIAGQQQQQQQQPIAPGMTGGSSAVHHSLTNGSSNNNNNSNAMALHHSVNNNHNSNNNGDAQWKDLWEALNPHLLDPSDVIAVVEEIMNDTTNKCMMPTEINFIVRRIRHVMASLPPKANTNSTAVVSKMRVFSNANNSQHNSNNATLEMEGKATAEKYHLISSYLFRRMLGGHNTLDSIPKPDTKEAAAVFPDPIETAYTLLLHLSSEALCEHAASIAVRTAEAAGLKLDVNEQLLLLEEEKRNHTTTTTSSSPTINSKRPPVPPGVVPKEDRPDLPPGITLQSFAYLLALALRK